MNVEVPVCFEAGRNKTFHTRLVLVGMDYLQQTLLHTDAVRILNISELAKAIEEEIDS